MDFDWNELPELLTFQDVRMILLISKPTLIKLLKNGDIPSFRVGNKYRIHRNELMKWCRYQ